MAEIERVYVLEDLDKEALEIARDVFHNWMTDDRVERAVLAYMQVVTHRDRTGADKPNG